MTTFGERLRDAMLVAGKSKTALARACQVSRQTVLKWLKMVQAELSGLHLDRAAIFLKCRIRWLVSGSGPAEPVGSDENIAEMIEIAKRLCLMRRIAWFTVGRLLARENARQP